MVTKLLRMVRHRWWVIGAVALLGATASVYFAQSRNAEIEPQFQATGSLAIQASEGSRNSARNASALEAALELAESVNADFIDANTGLVFADSRNSLLVFSATDRNEQSAINRVATMRSRWLDATREQILADRTARLDEIVTEANGVLDQIRQLTPQSSDAEANVIPNDILERFSYLDDLLGVLEPRVVGLEIDRVLSELGDPQQPPVEVINAQIAGFSARITEIRTEMRDLADEWGLTSARLEYPIAADADSGPQVIGPSGQDTTAFVIPPTTEDLAIQWQLDALTGQYTELGNEFEDLFAQGDEVTLPAADEVLAEDLTAARAPLAAFGAIGALFGSLVALGGVFGFARLQRRIYTTDDLIPVPVMAELPALGSLQTNAAPPEARVEGVKAIRNSLITLIKAGNATPAIGLTRVSIEQRHVRELAIELGRRLAASDLRVLVLDLDLDAAPARGDLSQYHSMTEFWSEIRRDPEAGADLLQRILSDRFETAPSTMCVIMAGAVQGDSDDVVLTRSFGIFLDVCRQEADIILAVAPDSEATATHSLVQALDGIIAVTGVGVSTRNQVVDLASIARAGGSRLLGTALLTGAPRDTFDRRVIRLATSERPDAVDEFDASEPPEFTAVTQNGSDLDAELEDLAESVATREPPA